MCLRNFVNIRGMSYSRSLPNKAVCQNLKTKICLPTGDKYSPIPTRCVETLIVFHVSHSLPQIVQSRNWRIFVRLIQTLHNGVVVGVEEVNKRPACAVFQMFLFRLSDSVILKTEKIIRKSEIGFPSTSETLKIGPSFFAK